MQMSLPSMIGDLHLRENMDCGRLDYQRGPVPSHIWRDVPDHDNSRVVEREYNRLQFTNDWIGRYAGKTVLIVGCGPQMKSMTKALAQRIANDPNIIVFGVNCCPKMCREMWGVDPDKFFDVIVAADLVPPTFYKEWQWDILKVPVTFRKKVKYRANDEMATLNLQSCGAPINNIREVYYVDSVTACLHLAIIALSERRIMLEKKLKKFPWTAGFSQPREDGKRCSGKIILLGVEHNRHDHAYSDVPGFYFNDDPNEPWPHVESKRKAHNALRHMAGRMRVDVVNGAPWSAIETWPFCDLEIELDVPAAERVGISTKRVDVARLYANCDCTLYLKETDRHFAYGEPAPPVPKPVHQMEG